jgi:hypothetical protein
VTTYNTLAAVTLGQALRFTGSYKQNTTQGSTTTGAVGYWIHGVEKIRFSEAGRDAVPSWVKERPGAAPNANGGNVGDAYNTAGSPPADWGGETGDQAALLNMSDKAITTLLWPANYERIVSGAGTLDLSRLRVWYRTA